MKQICTTCGEERNAEDDFSWKYKNRGIRNTKCKHCQSQVSKQHYQKHKLSYMVRSHARDEVVLRENRRKLAAYLACHPCVDCGITDIRVLEFDHVRGTKRGDIAGMMQLSCSWSTIEAEVVKCEVRCVNCHRIKTAECGGFWRSWGNFS